MRRITLLRLTVAAWVAWLVLVIATVWLALAKVVHPNWLSMAVPLAVQLVCTLAVLVGGVWRLARGPGRWRAVVCILYGVMPILWFAAYIEYGFRFMAGRAHRPNIAIKLGSPLASLVAEPYVRIRYPHPDEGKRFVMWSDAPDINPREMAAMDAHILAMEESLGERLEHKVYWVRGDICGISGRGGDGWALGSPWNAMAVSGNPGYVDLHEVAHCLLTHSEDAPKLLHEGWAQLHQCAKPTPDWRTFWNRKKAGGLYSLRELTSPERYYNSDDPMYDQGSVLVDYLLRKFGHAKFLELCRTCTEATFAADVNRVLGVTLDQLDRDYQNDFASQRSPTQRLFMAMKLAKGVDPAAWRDFVDHYAVGVQRLCDQFNQSSVVFRKTTEGVDNEGKKYSGTLYEESYRDNDTRAIITRAGREDVSVSTPSLYFSLERQRHEEPWTLREAFVRDRRRFDGGSGGNASRYLWMPLFPLTYLFADPCPGTTITEMRLDHADSRLIRISFQSAPSKSDKRFTRGFFELDPKKNYALVAERDDLLDGGGKTILSSTAEVRYEIIDGRDVPKWACWKAGQRHQVTDEIESCRFGPPPAKVFELATYGVSRPAEIPQTVAVPESPARPGILTWIAGGWTVVGLSIGVAGLFRLLCRRRLQSPTADVPSSSP
jgi:hypothetical protein